MEENVFVTGGKALTLEDYLQYDAGRQRQSRRRASGDGLPSAGIFLKEELIGQFGKEKQIEIFRNAGRKAGEYFAKKMLNLDQPLDQFVSELQSKMQELKIGVLRIEKVDEESGKIILNVSEDADCSGLPILGETVCNYDEGFIGGILSMYSGKFYTAVEVDCWATGDRVCRFHANIEDEK